MSSSTVSFLAAVPAALVVGLALWAFLRHRRHRARLRRIAERYDLSLTIGACPRDLQEKARWCDGAERSVRLREVLVGHDAYGPFFLANRKVGRRSHQLLWCDLGGHAHLDGFRVAPRAARGEDAVLRLEWTAPRSQWTDERALSMAARVMFHLSTIGGKPISPALGLEFRGRRAWIRTRHALRGARLDQFAKEATELRLLVIKALEKANRMERSQTGSREVAPLRRVS